MVVTFSKWLSNRIPIFVQFFTRITKIRILHHIFKLILSDLARNRDAKKPCSGATCSYRILRTKNFY